MCSGISGLDLQSEHSVSGNKKPFRFPKRHGDLLLRLESKDEMYHLIFWCSSAVLVALILLYRLFFNFSEKKNSSVRIYAKDADTVASSSLTAPTETNFGASSSSVAPTETNCGTSGSSIAPTETSFDTSSSSTAPTETTSDAFSLSTMTIGDHFDVFLSFIDRDFQEDFPKNIYNRLDVAGICFFKGDRGKELSSDLLKAINNSKILIPILSVNYGSSERCLDELVQIMTRKDNNPRQMVLPIFYKVEPTHVPGSDPTIVEKRKQALIKISSLKGWEAKGDEGQLVELVIRKVLIELKKAFQHVITENSVGIRSPMEKIMKFVDCHGSTLYVGIHGEGGVGKTTLAKVIYNKLFERFEHCSFIPNIRESCESNSIEYLQNQLISDMLKGKGEVDDMDQPITIISSRFIRMKVLILLDDVNTDDQLKALVGERNWFAPGSRIIVTTRYKSVLDWAEWDYKYKQKAMDEGEAKILFARHAFRRDSPPSDFFTLSHDVVSSTSMFPLTLEIIGSYLCGKSQALWKQTIQKLQELQRLRHLQDSQELQELQKLPQREVQEILGIVYSALESEQKKIFLDIACFLAGSDARIASCMWDANDFNVVLRIEELICMSLIKIGDNYELRMHDELRDFGRSIVGEGYCNEPDNGSRLWDYDLKMPEGKKGAENMRALSLDKGNSKKAVDCDSSDNSTDQGSQTYQSDKFTNVLTSRFLHVRDANLNGDFKEIFSKLRWLRWERCPQTLEDKEFGLEELAVLDLSRSLVLDRWAGWSSIMSAKKLKVLNLTGCRSLESTFFLSDFKNLEILILRNCDGLKSIQSSIGNLKTLVSLDLSGCLCLNELPEEVGNLEGLKELFLDQTEIRKIPLDSLKKLEILSAKECKFAQLPDSICDLVNLSTIVLSDCCEPLPASIWSLLRLRRLSLQRCRQVRLNRYSIVELESLTELVLTETGITELPESIGNLRNLGILNIRGTGIKMLPNGIERLTKLRELNASWCEKLSEVATSICKLSSLQSLDLRNCVQLQQLPKLPSNLTVVSVTCTSVNLPSFSHLIHLKKLRLHNCNSLECIPELPSTTLELEISGCESLTFLTPPEAVQDFEVLLKRLDIIRCKSLAKLDLSQLSLLRVLYALDCEKIHEIGGLDKLDSLESLTIQGDTSIELDKPFSSFR